MLCCAEETLEEANQRLNQVVTEYMNTIARLKRKNEQLEAKVDHLVTKHKEPVGSVAWIKKEPGSTTGKF